MLYRRLFVRRFGAWSRLLSFERIAKRGITGGAVFGLARFSFVILLSKRMAVREGVYCMKGIDTYFIHSAILPLLYPYKATLYIVDSSSASRSPRWVVLPSVRAFRSRAVSLSTVHNHRTQAPDTYDNLNETRSLARLSASIWAQFIGSISARIPVGSRVQHAAQAARLRLGVSNCCCCLRRRPALSMTVQFSLNASLPLF